MYVVCTEQVANASLFLFFIAFSNTTQLIVSLKRFHKSIFTQTILLFTVCDVMLLKLFAAFHIYMDLNN